MTTSDLEEEDYGPSKSELKRRAEHLQALGKELTELGAETLAKIDLPDNIVKEIEGEDGISRIILFTEAESCPCHIMEPLFHILIAALIRFCI